jgi:hypothetical protein
MGKPKLLKAEEGDGTELDMMVEYTPFLDDLADMDMSGVANGQVPAYNSGTGKYEPGVGSGINGLDGSIEQLDFSEQGSTSNKWLSIAGAYSSSNSNPAVQLIEGELIGFSFTNEQATSSTTIEIYKNGILATSKTLTSKNRFVKSNLAIASSALDRWSVYLSNETGTNPKDPVVILYIKVSGSATLGESSA